MVTRADINKTRLQIKVTGMGLHFKSDTVKTCLFSEIDMFSGDHSLTVVRLEQNC